MENLEIIQSLVYSLGTYLLTVVHLQNITIEGASVIDGDNTATNGVIHIINKVQNCVLRHMWHLLLLLFLLLYSICGGVGGVLSLNIKVTCFIIFNLKPFRGSTHSVRLSYSLLMPVSCSGFI